MHNIHKSMAVPALNVQPPISDAVVLSADMQQTLALLTAYGIDQRKLLRCSETGVLNTCSARLKDIVHYTGSGANDTQSGPDTPCSEVMVMGHPDNTGNVWVRSGGTATVNNAWPLAAGEPLGFAIDNLKQLSMLIVEDGEKLIVAYCR